MLNIYEIVLDIKEKYKHCIKDNYIYSNNWEELLLIFDKRYLHTLEKYNITSGLCPDCTLDYRLRHDNNIKINVNCHGVTFYYNSKIKNFRMVKKSDDF